MGKLLLFLRVLPVVIRITWKRPGLFTVTTFESMSTMMDAFLKVATHGRPVMFNLSAAYMEDVQTLVSVWVGKGAKASPWERIEELVAENEELKKRLIP